MCRSEPVRACARCIDPPRVSSPPRRSRRAGRRRLLDHHVRLIARHHRIDPRRRRAAHATSNGGRRWSLGRALPRQSGRSRRRGRLRPGAARHRPARAGRRGARTGGDPQSGRPRVLGAYGRALADNGNFQQALDVLNRAHTPGPAGLAHPVGAGRGARPDGPPRRGAALLRQRAAADAGRAVGAVQSRPVLRAVEESAAGRRRRCAAPPSSAGPSPRCGKISRWWSACRAASRRPRRSRAATCRPTRPQANVAYLRQMLAQQQRLEERSARLAADAVDRLIA